MEFLLMLCKMVLSSCFWAVVFGIMGKMRNLNYICTNNSSLKLHLLTCSTNSAGSVVSERSWFKNFNLWIQGFLILGTPLGAPEAEELVKHHFHLQKNQSNSVYMGHFSLKEESLAEQL